MPNAFARLVLVPALGRFRPRFPALELEVVLSDRDPDLVEEGLDCAVRASEIRESDLVARRIGTSRLVTCAAPSYLAGRAPVRMPADLADHDCLGRLGGGGRQTVDWRFERDGERIALNPRGPLLFNTMEACVDAAVEGLGIARVFSSLAHAPVMAGRLVPLLVDWTPPGPPVSVVYARNRYLSAKVRAFADFAAEIFPTESWWRDIVAVAARGAKPVRASAAGGRRRR
jgi:LysR family transcriptional regulator for bpeEF and oprC